MAKLSIVIPSRDERFLVPTIDDIFRNARGEIEVVAVIDSDKWPEGWKEAVARHPNLHTIHNGSSLGMRAAINRGVASAISRGATYVAKFDGHCSFGEGFDEILKAECEPDWVVVPRRLRLEPESWTIAEPDKPPYDYHYLSFPDDPKDFGGPGLNGKPWWERQKARADVLLDEEMSSQGSGWFMHADYFTRLELMDEASYGKFWNEFQEIGLKCWLSGGKVMVNKKTHYAHLHKGKKYGRGYRLEESALKQGRNHTMLWPWNEAWDGQTLPFEWLIDHFWPVPGWREDWREVLYAMRKPRAVGPIVNMRADWLDGHEKDIEKMVYGVDAASGKDRTVVHDGQGNLIAELAILSARYGVDENYWWDITDDVRKLVRNNSLDIVVNNSTLTPGRNPFRGKKKHLLVQYSYDGGEPVTVTRAEKDWLVIGQPRRDIGSQTTAEFIRDREGKGKQVHPAKAMASLVDALKGIPPEVKADIVNERSYPMSAPALNDYLIRKFSISPQRLRAPMPVELRDFHRNDLAVLFAELGFTKGAEIGVAEGNYSEIVLKVNPQLEQLLLVDPWHSYSANPQGKSKEKHEFAYNETRRKVAPYGSKVTMVPLTSMDAIFNGDYKIEDESLDWIYCDGNHLFDYAVSDLIWWSKKVRSGGLVTGDDWYGLDQARWKGGGVVEAVNAYITAHRIPVWYVFQGHKSVDFMWVKP